MSGRTPTHRIRLGLTWCRWILVTLLVVAAGYLALDVAVNIRLGCPAGTNVSNGPDATLSLLPVGVTCEYTLADDEGTLVTSPSVFPTLIVAAAVVGLVAVHRMRSALAELDQASTEAA